MAIFVTRSSMPTPEEYLEEIKLIFENHHMTNMGPIYERLRAQLKDYLDVPGIFMFANGHLALELVLQALGLDKTNGEVITTPFTFVSTTNAIVRNGLRPVFCDIKPDDCTMDPTKIEALITDKTVAIMPVHVYGNLCDVEAIEKIADKHGLKVIYDAAHAFGVTYKGVGVGNFGDASMFSFHATKVFNTIEGGGLTFRDPALEGKLRQLQNFGLDGEDVTEFGTNAKMDEFRAAMGICNLRNIDAAIASRKAAAQRYDERLGNVPGLRVNRPQKDVVSNYAYYPVFFDKAVFGKDRDEVAALLGQQDIFARKYFYPAINEMTCYQPYHTEPTPIAHEASMSVLTLPLYEGLSVEEVDRICDVILGQ